MVCECTPSLRCTLDPDCTQLSIHPVTFVHVLPNDARAACPAVAYSPAAPAVHAGPEGGHQRRRPCLLHGQHQAVQRRARALHHGQHPCAQPQARSRGRARAVTTCLRGRRRCCASCRLQFRSLARASPRHTFCGVAPCNSGSLTQSRKRGCMRAVPSCMHAVPSCMHAVPSCMYAVVQSCMPLRGREMVQAYGTVHVDEHATRSLPSTCIAQTVQRAAA
eukprot:365819-Chlamydomonas_euryale.AAC.4